MTSLAADAVSANKFYETVTQNILGGDQYSAAERKDIDVLMRKRDRLLARIAKIETNLITIQKDGVLIKKHCSATPDEVQAAIQAYKQKHYDAECLVVGMKFQLQNLKGQAPKAPSIKLRTFGLGLLSSLGRGNEIFSASLDPDPIPIFLFRCALDAPEQLDNLSS